jgi:hypothetical protein
MNTTHPQTAPVWRKSIRSADNEACVEVADLTTTVGVRDSKNPGTPALRFAGKEWSSFVGAVRSGRLDLA